VAVAEAEVAHPVAAVEAVAVAEDADKYVKTKN